MIENRDLVTMGKKKILFITPFSPGTNHAGIVYTRQLLAELSKDCFIDLVFFHYKMDNEYTPPSNINILLKVELSTLFKLKGIFSLLWLFPIFSARHNKKICNFLKSQIQKVKYDYIYFDFSQTFSYAQFLKHSGRILMSHDVIAQKYSRMRTYLKPWAMHSERKLLHEGTVFTFSEKDCRIIYDLYHINSLPTTFFLSQEVKDALPSIDDYFVFFGGWLREENFEALEWYIDNVNPLIPQIKYIVIGGGLPDKIKKKINSLKNFDYMGFVENPYPFIAAAKAEIAPLKKGAGVKVKCIDALGCGTPIIGTSVAFEGIPDEFNHFMILANSADEYANAINNINFSIKERLKFKSYFIKKYDNRNILKFIDGSISAIK